VLVLGSIIGGIATVNQAGAIGAVGALVMAGYRLHPGGKLRYVPAILALLGLAIIGFVLSNYNTNVLNIQTAQDVTGVTLAVIGVLITVFALGWSGYRAYKTEDALVGVMVETAKTTSLVFIILLGAAMLTAAFRAFGGEEIVKHFLEGLPGGFWTKFIIVMVVIFVLGFFLDFIEIAVVVVPIVAPILLADPEANVTAVWLGVMIGLNIQTSFLTPPFGFALFYLRGVASKAVKTIQIYKGVLPFIGLQLTSLVIVAYNPPLVNYLPSRSSLLSDTAPPPVNPALQFCVEDYVAEEFDRNRETIAAAIDRAAGLDMSYLPSGVRDDFMRSVDKAREGKELMEEIETLKVQLEAEAVEYRPQHVYVRGLQRDARRIEDHIEELEVEIRRGFGDTPALEQELAEEQTAREALLAQIPDSWEAAEAEYGALAAQDRRTRGMYRRTVDQAYEPLVELMAMIEGGRCACCA
jgi:hypothetical protein